MNLPYLLNGALVYTLVTQQFNQWQFYTLSLYCGLWSILAVIYSKTNEIERKTRLEQAIPLSRGLIKESWYNIMDIFCVNYRLVFYILIICSVFEMTQISLVDKVSDGWIYILKHYSQKDIFVNGIFGIHIIVFWVGSILHAILDFTCPKSIRIYKIQDDERIPLKTWAKGVPLVLLNEVIAYCLVNITYYLYLMDNNDGFSKTIPNILSIITQLAAFATFSEIWFYTSHRIMHKSNLLWKYVHSVHHEIKAPSIFFSLYTHPIEYIVGNFPTLAIGPIILGSHCTVWLIWVFISTLDFCNGHSGWHLPFGLSPEFHDYHHRAETDNYGTGLRVLDKIFKTDDRLSGSVRDA